MRVLARGIYLKLVLFRSKFCLGTRYVLKVGFVSE